MLDYPPTVVDLRLSQLFRAYGIIVLVVECLGASTVILYGLNLLFVSAVPEKEVNLFLLIPALAKVFGTADPTNQNWLAVLRSRPDRRI